MNTRDDRSGRGCSRERRAGRRTEPGQMDCSRPLTRRSVLPFCPQAIAMTVPMFFSTLSMILQYMTPYAMNVITRLLTPRPPDYYHREIVFEKITTHWGSEVHGRDQRNNILQKAISLYLNEITVQYRDAKLNLVALKEKGTRDQESWTMQYGTTADQLKAYKVTTVPQENQWIEIDEGLFFMKGTDNHDEDRGDPNKGSMNNGDNRREYNKEKICFHFRTALPNGDEVINAWIEKAFEWYVDEMEKLQDNSRYMYVLAPDATSLSNNDSQDDNQRKYKRYKLSEEKTFSALFFPEKEQLLKLMEHFQAKTGKYEIEGYPHKLGLLLHGPPGTGKTSLIKAMAIHTRRNIVSVNLSRIKTNQELMDIVFDQSFAVGGEDMPVKLSFKDIIFVMEDIDAASEIVKRRETKTKKKNKKKALTTTITRQVTKKAEDASGKESKEEEEEEEEEVVENKPSLLEEEEEEDEKKDKEAQEAEQVTTIKHQTTYDSKVNDDDTEPDKEMPTMEDLEALATMMMSGGSEGEGKGKKASSIFSRNDKLDLSGLLNVLDGVVDCPGRIVIMTTNHPEKLDPALIRPGRVDKMLLLDYIKQEQCEEMVKHYFGLMLTDEQKEQLQEVFDQPIPVNFTPATIEQICAEHETIDDFIEALSAKLPAVLPKM
uniref:AAA+ ATPase domain-containing protein n=1 Tax=Pinguiococcus pyrenoidosus TaxID=172671 RepID=A0A7R9U422_9STRA|mmetsp:Transcript_13428/g.49926  ORF Transcript_13428/g.49926 Transcript_13428/m.49926 type:complete len:658 (+) Transcript_13428:792-2765(+)